METNDRNVARTQETDYVPETQPGGARSAASLIRELTQETSILFRQEMGLAKQEMSEKAHKATRQSASVAVGGALAFAGLIVLVLAISGALFALLNTFLISEVAIWLAPLIVSLLVAGIGYALIKKGINTLKREGVVPDQTVQTMQENKEWLKQEIK
ncbi:MAG: phage holin family protein [Planctomycetota bacterium]